MDDSYGTVDPSFIHLNAFWFGSVESKALFECMKAISFAHLEGSSSRLCIVCERNDEEVDSGSIG